VRLRHLAAVLLLLSPGRLKAVELHIQFAALERMLAEQVFTQEGRRYVHGSQTTRCNFAYLEKPQIREEGGRLRIRARFTGRSALNVFGQCMGLGDAFDVVILARPAYKSGNLGLSEVSVSSGRKTGYYIRRVCEALQASLARDFRYPLAAVAQKALEDPSGQPGYQREMRNFTAPEVRVSADALVLVLDFQLTVK
jgi:hypothetical protein